MGLWRCRAARRRTGSGARRNPPRAPVSAESRALSHPVAVLRVRSQAPGEGRRKTAFALSATEAAQAVLGFGEEVGGNPPAALQDRFDRSRAAAEFGDAFAPVVGCLDVAVEGLLGGGADGVQTVDFHRV